jgi:hypothetical protein
MLDQYTVSRYKLLFDVDSCTIHEHNIHTAKLKMPFHFPFNFPLQQTLIQHVLLGRGK